MVWVLLIVVVPTAGKLVIEGSCGSMGKTGVATIFPPAGVGPVYVVPDGCVAEPETMPPPTKIFPLASILPFSMAPVPVEIILPVDAFVLAALIMPCTVLLLDSRIVPPE